MVKWLAVIDKNGLTKLYPNKKQNINKKHGLQKVSLSPSKQKTYTIKKLLKHNENSGTVDTNIIETLLTN